MPHNTGADYRNPLYLLTHVEYLFSLFDFVPTSI